MAIKNKFDETQTKQLNDTLSISQAVKHLIPMVSLTYIDYTLIILNNYRKLYIITLIQICTNYVIYTNIFM